MRKELWILLLLGMVCLSSCNYSRNNRLLDCAEVCMKTNADSARYLLMQLDSVLTEEQQARYALLWTQAQHKCHIPLEEDSLINMAVDYYGRIGKRHLLAKALLYKGLLHKQHGQVQAATIAFVSSEQAFEGVEDNQYKALLFNHYASLLTRQNLFDEALEYHKKAYRYKLKGDSIHYVVSSCGQIARIYSVKKMADSAEFYYRCGMRYAEQCMECKKSQMFLQNYAAFLIDLKQYEEAERLLKEAELHADSNYIYNVYSSLATLYYEMRQNESALRYAEKASESTDSLIRCVAYLRLSEIHKRLGNTEMAFEFHYQYRQYDSDITLRHKTAEVAVIPHVMKNKQLVEEHRTATLWKWIWGVGVMMVMIVFMYSMRRIRHKHGLELRKKDLQLGEAEHHLDKMKVGIGGLKGVVTKQTRTIEGLRNEQKEMRTKHGIVVKELKREIMELKDEQTEMHKVMKNQICGHKQELKQMYEKEKQLRTEIKVALEELDNSQLLQRFLMNGGSVRSVLLLIELKSGISNPRYLIKRAEYTDLLKQLAEFAHPGIQQLIETDKVLTDKQEMAYLISLGYDDTEMLCRATNLKPNSVKAYRAQVRAALKKTIYTAPAK